MIVFLRNIPKDTSHQDILDFVGPVVKGGLLQSGGKVASIEFLEIQDGNAAIVEYHGLVHILPDEVGLRVIRKLNRQHFKGKRIVVREYVVRSWHNDRRDPSKQGDVPEGRDRRQGQVRRSNLRVRKLKSLKPEPK